MEDEPLPKQMLFYCIITEGEETWEEKEWEGRRPIYKITLSSTSVSPNAGKTTAVLPVRESEKVEKKKLRYTWVE
jgi:hypothetical protein